MATSDQQPMSSTKACVTCRAQKTRCVVISDDGNAPCQRCASFDRPCVFPAVQRRKPRKRTDTRVAELEKELMRMKQSLQQNARSSSNGSVSPNPSSLAPTSLEMPAPTASLAPSDADIVMENVQNDGTRTMDLDTAQPVNTQSPCTSNSSSASIDYQTAARLFKTYNQYLVPHFPAVVFPLEYTAEDLRSSKPTLFLAVMAAAAMHNDSDLADKYYKLVLESYATRIFINSEKTLELVQSLLLSAMWYTPPGSKVRAKYYEYIHMATVMALDIELGTKPPVQADSSSGGRFVNGDSNGQSQDNMQTELESKRTFICCYIMCCGVSVSLRRPTMLRQNDWLKECVETLRCDPAAIASDRCLAAWVGLLKIAEDMLIAFRYSDLTKVVHIKDPQTPQLLKDFEERLLVWRQSFDECNMNDLLELNYHTMNVHIHEVALHMDHAPHDFLCSFTFERIRTNCNNFQTSPAQIRAIVRIITSAHLAMQAFLNVKLDLVRSLPVFNYIRMWYCIVCLEMLSTSIDNPAGDLGEYISKESLEIDLYLSWIISRIQKVVESGNSKVPPVFLELFQRRWTARRQFEQLPMHSTVGGELNLDGRQTQVFPANQTPGSGLSSTETRPPAFTPNTQQQAREGAMHHALDYMPNMFGMDDFQTYYPSDEGSLLASYQTMFQDIPNPYRMPEDAF